MPGSIHPCNTHQLICKALPELTKVFLESASLWALVVGFVYLYTLKYHLMTLGFLGYMTLYATTLFGEICWHYESLIYFLA